MEISFYAFLLAAIIFVAVAGSVELLLRGRGFRQECLGAFILTVLIGIPLTFGTIVESGVFVTALFIAAVYVGEFAFFKRYAPVISIRNIVWLAFAAHLLCAAGVIFLGWQAGWLETYPIEWTEENGNWLQSLPYSSWYWLYGAIILRCGLQIYYWKIAKK